GEGPFQPPVNPALDPISHVLNRAGFGPRPRDYEKTRKLGKNPAEAAWAWLEQQLHPEDITDDTADYATRRFETLSEPLGELFEYQPDLLHNELMRSTLVRAVLSERQLYEVMVQFWSDHFNIDPSKGDAKWLKVADDRLVIRPHALGAFPDMLRASALSPAMLWYLDGRVNRRSTASDKPNENYARELLELHTLGVHGGYTQKDVMEVARCLTGWTVRSTDKPPYFQVGKVEFHPEQHDFGAKEFLGERIPAVAGSLPKTEREVLGRHELERVLQIVISHPATAQHLATKLCRHLICDDPPAAVVTKVAETFHATDGDIRVVLRTLFGTEEFRQARGRKFKRPFTYIVSALRATAARTDAGIPLIDYLRRMGHAPFSYPTPEGYADKAEPWMGTLLWRWNFALALSHNQISGTRVDLDGLRKHAGGDAQLMAHMLGRLPSAAETEAYHDSHAGLALLLACPAFQYC
ncbi:MAG TPA: DUF1800 domain-containing protein, partial [Terriglobales bacterium]|nr:DUF1800 domain-containing protein [Terriglobales bacterium]